VLSVTDQTGGRIPDGKPWVEVVKFRELIWPVPARITEKDQRS
jgi:hypothetical protein